ncbi:hypothetical protein C1H76_6914 [Elsinoe australis]|uniref:Uncharacterized protein n=1 Tax=Elsinoe australis TaxID=40998 RepID=A0A4U7B0M5_9PEZI|nr:hypothetical protein C1H76_6914 [Elsinoe australis]
MSLPKKCQYEAVAGFFFQSDPATDAAVFDYVSKQASVRSKLVIEALSRMTKDLGLVAGTPDPIQGTTNSTPWHRFTRTLQRLNDEAPLNATYHLIYLGRHGQGWHNVAESKYGTQAWDDHFSKLDSCDGMHFLDARLTETGRQQARLARDTFSHALAAGLPAPEAYINATPNPPPSHAITTLIRAFPNIYIHKLSTKPCHAIIILAPSKLLTPSKLLREVIGEQTCDKRSPKTEIQARHPDFFVFEQGFAEDDPFWRPDARETEVDIDARMRKFLDEVLGQTYAKQQILSFTAHSGAIASILRVTGHRPFALQTGGVIPVVVKTIRE